MIILDWSYNDIYRKYTIKKIICLYKVIDILILMIILLIIKPYIKERGKKINLHNERNIAVKLNNKKISFKKCYIPLDYVYLRIIHLIITRFIIELPKSKEFTKNIYSKEFILNGFRVMEKYLLPSLESQTCNDFVWILMIGNKVNKTYIESILDFNSSFRYKIIYKNEFQNYLKNVSKAYDVLIQTRMDYDDRIYYDAVNDIRKVININKPILLHGYNRGVLYFESNKKYYELYNKKGNEGALGLFLSLILFTNNTNKLNHILTIFEIGNHWKSRKTLLEKYKSYGIKELDYDPAVFDSGGEKFVYVRQKYSHSYNYHLKRIELLKEQNFNLNQFLA